MTKTKKGSIESRKESHIKICLEENIESDISAGFDDVVLVHHSIPDIDKEDIDLSVNFLGKRMNAPIIIEAITGGAKIAKNINKNLAKAAEEAGIAFGVGSVRAAMVDEKLWDTYTDRNILPRTPIISNIGLVQLIEEYDIKEIQDSVKRINADGIAIHLNALQEVVQPEGNIKWKDSFVRLKYFCQNLGIPVIVKETGAGISRETAIMIEKSGANVLDIAGLGGTSFSMVEHYRDKKGEGLAFKNWGIPTVCSIIECRNAVKMPIIASGGIRSGIDMAKAIALGADYVGIALPLLDAATKSHKNVGRILEKMIDELKSAMFLVGAKNIDELKKKDAIILGRTKEWLVQRGIKVENLSNKESIESLRNNVRF